MRRIHGLQLCDNLSDQGVGDLLYEAEAPGPCAGLNLAEPLQDETTILHFRDLRERQGLGTELCAAINAQLPHQWLRLQASTIVDASIIAAPSSTKSQRRQREPELHQTKRGNEWRLGMKLHIGVDAGTGVAHSLSTTAAYAANVTEPCRLLRGGQREDWSDAGDQCVERSPDLAGSEGGWRVAMHSRRRRQLEPGTPLAQRERASMRAKVECPFLFIKRRFGYAETRYRGMTKSEQRLALSLGLANPLIAETQLARAGAESVRLSQSAGANSSERRLSPAASTAGARSPPQRRDRAPQLGFTRSHGERSQVTSRVGQQIDVGEDIEIARGLRFVANDAAEYADPCPTPKHLKSKGETGSLPLAGWTTRTSSRWPKSPRTIAAPRSTCPHR